jgi:hypothetical protein
MFWLGVIDTLAQGNVLNYDPVCELPLFVAFNKLSYDKSIKTSYTNTILTSGLNLMALKSF